MSKRTAERPEVWAVVLAAGAGQRMAAPTNKVFLLVGGRAILARTLDVLQHAEIVDGIVLVTTEADRATCGALVAAQGYDKVRHVVTGGPTRHASEWSGLRALEQDIESGKIGIVLIHDAVRPFISTDELSVLVEEARTTGAAIPAMPAGDRIVIVDAAGAAHGAGDDLWIAQTPQAFRASLVLEAHRRAAADGFVGADTSAVVEHLGHPVSIVPGRAENIKITTVDDLLRAEIIAEELDEELAPTALGTLDASS